MNEKVKQQFDAVAQQYDMQRRQLIPCFDDFYGSAVKWLDIPKPSPKILDLGAGTGLLSAFILAKYPKAEMTLIDFSDQMLNEARRRLAAYDNVKYIAADYLDYPFEEDNAYCAVVSSLSIHHLPHPDKQALFRKVHRLLRDGGFFINADQAAGATPFIDSRYRAMWEEEVRASGLSVEAIEASIERRKLDINAKTSEQLEWLGEAGFSEAECVYKYHDFNVFYARKAPSFTDCSASS